MVILQGFEWLEDVVTVMPVERRGPFEPFVFDELNGWLSREGYAPSMVPQVMGVARALSVWMADHHFGVGDVCCALLEDFQSRYGPGVAGHSIVAMRMSALRRFLIEAGYLTDAVMPRKVPRPPNGKPRARLSPIVEAELDEWTVWLADVRGVGRGCIRYRREWVKDLVQSLPHGSGGLDWGACGPKRLNDYVAQRSAGYSQASACAIVDSVRSLMRWALATGRVDRDVTGGILRVQASRVTLPKGLTPDQVQLLLGACDTDTLAGLRDLAVIWLLWRLGLRAGECSGLQLDDLNWAEGTLAVVGKGQRRLVLPIPYDVGGHLVEWLRHRPSQTQDRAVFVRLRSPIEALSRSGISGIVKRRAHKAGLGLVHAHRLRHTAATNVVTAGGSVNQAQNLLGHQHATTTGTYARVDVDSLRSLAVPFGQVPR